MAIQGLYDDDTCLPLYVFFFEMANGVAVSVRFSLTASRLSFFHQFAGTAVSPVRSLMVCVGFLLFVVGRLETQ